MCIKEQLKKLKDNWLLIVLLIVAMLIVSSGGGTFSALNYAGRYAQDSYVAKSAPMMEAARGYGYDSGFAPDVNERKITKTAYLDAKVDRGDFETTHSKLKDLVEVADAYLLDEDVNTYGETWRSYKVGRYQIKVETSKYDSMVSQLKELGEVSRFSENFDDVTATYNNLEIELEVEKARLARYQEMYKDAERTEDKITLSDRIFNQERTIKYYEDRLESVDQRIDYSTVYVTINEERSGYVGMAFVKFSELVRKLVDSVNTLLGLIFMALPWLVLAGVVFGLYKLTKQGNKKR